MRLRMFKMFALILVTSLLLTTSCTQDEGIGGNSHIKGVLIEKYYNNDFSVFQYEEPAKDDDVFLLYGDQQEIGDKTSTSFSGNFQFEYLWSGDYKLYYYSDDSTLTASDKIEIVHNITLEKGETLNLGTLYAYKSLDWNEGKATIQGKVMLINYYNGGKDSLTYAAQEQDVYIVYNNAEFYADRIKTAPDGSFEFKNLLKGKYKIFVYSEDVIFGGKEMLTKEVSTEITELEQTTDLPVIYIQKS